MSVPPPGQAPSSAPSQPPRPAPSHTHTRPTPLPPLIRIDTQAIKQELHDALGENGLAYWKAMNGYLVGQLSRRELEGMVKGWLKGDKLGLHNKLLISLLHNASTPSQAPSAPNRKRKRVPAHDPEFDIDEVVVEPKMRVSQWIGMLTNRDRGRLKRGMAQNLKAEEENAGNGDGEGEGETKVDPEAAVRKSSSYTPDVTLPSMTIPDRSLPSALQISTRLGAYATANDLQFASTDETSEFVSVGLDDHLSEILHGLVHLTGRSRPGTETIQIPLPSSQRDNSGPETDPSDPAIPLADIETLHHFINLNPSTHPHPSPTIYQLRTGHTLGQINAHQPSHKRVDTSSRPVSPTIQGSPHPVKQKTETPLRHHHLAPSPPSSPPQPIVPMNLPGSHRGTLNSMVSGLGFISHRAEAVGRNLLESGLLKIEVPDKGEEEKEGGKGKKKKHGLHWKYEDPAFILKDILG